MLVFDTQHWNIEKGLTYRFTSRCLFGLYIFPYRLDEVKMRNLDVRLS